MRAFPDTPLLLILGLSTVLAGTHPDLSGRWRINISKGDDPFTMLKFDTTGAPQRPEGGGGRGQGGYGGRPGAEGFGGRGMGGGGTRRGGGGMPRRDSAGPQTDAQRQAFRQTLRLALSPPPLLQIAQSDSALTFGSETAPTAPLVLYDGSTMVVPATDSIAEVTITARWIGNAFLVTRQVAGGGRVSEDYVKAADGAQIAVYVHFDGGLGRTLDFRLICDLVSN